MSRYLFILLFIVPVAGLAKTIDRGVYIGGGLSLINIGVEDFFGDDVSIKANEISFGYKAFSFLGLEVRGGLGFDGEPVALGDPENPTPGEVEIGHFYSYYYRAEYAREFFKIYALYGETTINTFVNESTGSTEIDQSGTSYILGLGIPLNDTHNIGFEFRSLVDFETDNFTSFGMMLEFRF